MLDHPNQAGIAETLLSMGSAGNPFVAAVQATRMPMVITDPKQPDNPIIFANEAFSKLTGYEPAEIIGRNCRFLQGPETSAEALARLSEAVARRERIEIDLVNYNKKGERFWNRLLVSPVFDEAGDLSYFFASQADVTLEKERLVQLREDRDALEREVERRTRALVQSEERMRFVLEAGRLGFWTLELEPLELVCSDACKSNVGLAPDEDLPYERLLNAILDEDRGRMQTAVRTSIEERQNYDIEYRVRTPSGEVRWLQVRGQPAYDPEGRPLRLVGISLDITDRKRSEEHRALLTAELNHRVKNSMATIQSIVSQTLRFSTSLAQAQTTLDARLQSLARAHDVLTRESWEGADMVNVVADALSSFQSSGFRRFTIAGPSVRLSPRMALAFVMALHELATNAVKYGALSVDAGRVVVNWDQLDGPAGPRFWFRWEEIGGPPVQAPSRRGFGTRVIERALGAEFNGQAETEFRERGIVFTLDAPSPSV